MGMKGILFLTSLSIISLYLETSCGKAVNTEEDAKSPVYDEKFMKKLCSYFGATYVRNAKDPRCWYTWCHDGEPFHMQCPAGRAVSSHFFWGAEDPCTEKDEEEKCLLGYLKKMHLDAVDDSFKIQGDQDTSVVLPNSLISTNEIENKERNSENQETSDVETLEENNNNKNNINKPGMEEKYNIDLEPAVEINETNSSVIKPGKEWSYYPFESIIIKPLSEGASENPNNELEVKNVEREHFVHALIPSNMFGFYGNYNYKVRNQDIPPRVLYRAASNGITTVKTNQKAINPTVLDLRLPMSYQSSPDMMKITKVKFIEKNDSKKVGIWKGKKENRSTGGKSIKNLSQRKTRHLDDVMKPKKLIHRKVKESVSGEPESPGNVKETDNSVKDEVYKKIINTSTDNNDLKRKMNRKYIEKKALNNQERQPKYKEVEIGDDILNMGDNQGTFHLLKTHFVEKF